MSSALVLPLLGSFHARAQADAVIRVSSAQGEPGEEVTLDFRGDLSEPARTILVQFDVLAAAAEFLRVDVQNTASEHVHPRGIFFNPRLFKGGYMAGVDFIMETGQVGPGDDLLLFRAVFRIRHDAAPGESPVSFPASHVTTVGGRTLPTTVVSETRLTVLPPSGPRPVGGLVCTASSRGVSLSWSSVETYDAIHVLRDGVPLEVLPGDAASHSDAPPPGPTRYEVLGTRGGERSLRLACEVLVDVPRPEPIADLQCSISESGVGLVWTNGEAYDAISVLRNGRAIAEVPGSATSHDDPLRTDLFTIYTVRGRKDGVETLPSSCRVNELSDRFLLWADDVRAVPGQARVEVPFFITNPEPLSGLQVALRVDPAGARISELSVDGTASDSAQYDYFAYQKTVLDRGETAAGLLFDHTPPKGFLFPPGGHQHFLTLRVDLLPETASGHSIPVELGRTGKPFGSPRLGCWISVSKGPGHDLGMEPDLQEGSILIGQSPVPELEGARAIRGGGEGGGAVGGAGNPGDAIRLSWRNGGAYDRIRIERDGEFLTEIPGDAENHLDSNPGPGVHRYRLVALQGEASSFPAVVWARPEGIPGTFVRGDADGDEIVGLTDAVFIVQALLLGGPQPGCFDAADGDDNGRLDLTDAIVVLLHLYRGGGPLPPPGSDPWFDPTDDALSCG